MKPAAPVTNTASLCIVGSFQFKSAKARRRMTSWRGRARFGVKHQAPATGQQFPGQLEPPKPDVGGGDLARAIQPRPKFPNARLVDVEADDPTAAARECHRDRQAPISEANNRKLSAMRHKLIFQPFATPLTPLRR